MTRASDNVEGLSRRLPAVTLERRRKWRGVGRSTRNWRALAAQASASYRSANSMSYDDVIDPRELRNALLNGLALSDGRAAGPFEPAQHLGIDP